MSAANKRIKCSYTWTVEDCGVLYLTPDGPCRSSPVFVTSVSGELLKWQLNIVYFDHESDKSLDILLQALSSNSSECAVSFAVHLTSPDGRTSTRRATFDYDSMDDHASYVFHSLLARDFRLKSDGEDCLRDCSLTILCDVFFELPAVSSYAGGSSSPSAVVHGSKDFDKFEEYFESGQLSDAKIVVAGGEEFPAHKLILSLRSKVFAAMFTHDMQEKSESLIKIDDVDGDVIREMLRFMYAGKVQDMERLSGELLAVADKYEVQELKDLCERELIRAVSLENFHRIFVLADLHRAEKLKRHMIEFLAKQAEECSKIMANRQ